MLVQPPGELRRGRRLIRRIRHSSESSPRRSIAAASGAADDARAACAPRAAGRVAPASRVTVAPSSASWLPGQELRRRVDDDVGALVERAQEHRRRDGRVADDEPGVARAPRPSRARSAPGSRATRPRRRRRPPAAGRSGRTRRRSRPQRASCANGTPVPKYAPSASAIVAPGRQSANTHGGHGRGARGVEQRVAALELAERTSAAAPVGCA